MFLYPNAPSLVPSRIFHSPDISELAEALSEKAHVRHAGSEAKTDRQMYAAAADKDVAA